MPHDPCVAYMVYPRVCGGTRISESDGVTEVGLSPRVRGNQVQEGHILLRAGSIPACAGEPYILPAGAWANTVYPRVCGGTLLTWPALRSGWGLSPRVRGNLDANRALLRGVGSIPACAGEPGLPAITPRPIGVYPRVCGGTCPRGGGVVE